MHINHLAWLPSDEMSAASMTTDRFDADIVFMFGTFDPTKETGAEGIHALDEAILGIREDSGSTPAAARSHSHVAPAGDGSSDFMFGIHREQPSVQMPGEWLLHLGATELQ